MGWSLAPLMSNTSLNKKSPLTSHEICCITSLSEQPSATAYSSKSR